MDFPTWPSFSTHEANIASEILLSNKVNYWTGTHGKSFEQEFAHKVGCHYGVALANGTVALELALKASGVSRGDEVIVTCRTFIASASSILAVGAIPVFADVDLNSQNITAATITPLITPKTRAIVCVHLAGWPCEMQPIMELAKQHNLKVIEDCAQAHGAQYKGKPVGCWGDVAAWSFCQDKIITTAGEGGMLTTNDESIWHQVWSAKDHGKSPSLLTDKLKQDGQFKWLHQTYGSNLRLTEIQSAIGRWQLTQLDTWVEQRNANARKLRSLLADEDTIVIPQVPEYSHHAYYKFYGFINNDSLKTNWSRDRILSELCLTIPIGTGACPEVYLEKTFEKLALSPTSRLVNAQHLGQTSLMLPVHPTLTENALCFIAEQLKLKVQEARR